MKTLLQTIMLAAAATAGTAAALPAYDVKANHEDCLYRCGEMASFTVTILDTTDIVMDSMSASASLDNFGPHAVTNLPITITNGATFTIAGTLHKPGFLRLNLPRTNDGRANPFTFSAAYEPERIRKGSPFPDDFDIFWSQARAKLAREVPPDVRLTKIPERSTNDLDFHRLSLATFGRRVHGYMSIPKDAAKAPFPVRFGVNAAGFGAWTNDMKGEPDRICVQFSVYPFEPDWKWRETGLKAQFDKMDAEAKERFNVERYCTAGIAEGRESYFFYAVLLGIDRAVDWVASRPDVDKTRFTYAGTSQGGGFGLYLCGLNHAFTRAALFVPAITDTMGYLAGRESGWPKIVEGNASTPAQRAAAERWAPYFDGANFASRIRCPVRIAVGFSDTTCPPCAVYATYNEITVPDKAIMHGIGMTHNCSQRFYAELGRWLKK